MCATGQRARSQVSRCIGLSGSDREFPALTGRPGTQRARPLRPELAAPLGVWPSSRLTRRAGWRLSGDVAVRCCCTAPAYWQKTPAAVLAGRPSAFRPDTQRLCPAAPGICPVTARTFQGMAPYPGQPSKVLYEARSRLSTCRPPRPCPEISASAKSWGAERQPVSQDSALRHAVASPVTGSSRWNHRMRVNRCIR